MRQKVGIICAGDREVAPFIPMIDECKVTDKAMLKFYEGKINGVETVVEENQVLRKWYESFGFVHIVIQKFEFFPFTCGYMEKGL